MITSVEALFIILAFVVPGFVISVVRSQFAIWRPQKGTEALLGYLTLSAMNYAVFSWLVYILAATGFARTHPGWAALLWFLIILVGPAALGAGLGGRLRKAHWVLVKLKDGSMVGGFFGTRSFASSDPEERDI